MAIKLYFLSPKQSHLVSLVCWFGRCPHSSSPGVFSGQWI